MSVTLLKPATALAPGLSMSTAGTGGTAPYTYSVMPGGAGGTINSQGVYTAPAVAGTNARTSTDTIRVTDSVFATGSGNILVGPPLLLLCDIISNQMRLAADRVYLWDQKIDMPKDGGLFIAVSVLREKVFGHGKTHDGSGGGLNSGQSVNVMAGIGIDIISRGSEARDRKEEVVMAFLSDYAEYQMEANSFSIGRLPLAGSFINLSYVDGAAIPYRFHLDVNLQYFVTKTQAVPFFDTFTDTVITNQ